MDIEAQRPSWRSGSALRGPGEKPADVALAWLLNNKVVTAPIIGPRTVEQLDGSLRALEITLSETR
jgi:aryl-alcohol dehydrogenase-like predicted oxidoreductase